MRVHLLVAAATLNLFLIPTESDSSPTGPFEAGAEGGGTSPRVSNLLNPAISFNGLVRASWRQADTDDDALSLPLAGPETGLSLQEAELILSAGIDPYFKADAIVALEDAAADGEEGFEVDLEEAYVTALALPRGLGLRVGKMFLPFGRHNQLHTHAYPFIQPALVNQRLFGREALNEVAIEGSWLLPAPWYSRVVAVVGDGRNEDLFGETEPEDLMFLAHFKNLWDLSDAATLELGGSALYGQRGDDGDTAATAFGVNATWKYRPTRRSAYRAWEVQAELVHRDLDRVDLVDIDELLDAGEPGDVAGLGAEATGGYLHVRFQAARRWWLQARYDRVDYPSGRDEQRWSALVAFIPSELSSLRFEYATLDPVFGDRDHQLIGQLNFNIGSHPAHSY